MNLSNFLPGLAKDEDREPTEAELDEADAQAKAQRIQWHRDHVRNGPAKFKVLTEGRAAAIERRRAKAANRKANKRYRRDFLRAQTDLSRLRGQLETVGAIKTSAGVFMVGQPVPLMRNAMRGLYAGYGSVVQETLDETGAGKLDFDNLDHRELVVEAAKHHYALATGGVK